MASAVTRGLKVFKNINKKTKRMSLFKKPKFPSVSEEFQPTYKNIAFEENSLQEY